MMRRLHVRERISRRQGWRQGMSRCQCQCRHRFRHRQASLQNRLGQRKTVCSTALTRNRNRGQRPRQAAKRRDKLRRRGQIRPSTALCRRGRILREHPIPRTARSHRAMCQTETRRNIRARSARDQSRGGTRTRVDSRNHDIARSATGRRSQSYLDRKNRRPLLDVAQMGWHNEARPPGNGGTTRERDEGRPFH